MGFFDGACKNGQCGCGVLIITEPDKYYHFWWEGGTGSNNRAEIIALWGLLFTASSLNINTPQIFGDYKGCIDWMNGLSCFQPPLLAYWMKRICILIRSFQHVDFNHIYMEKNIIADLRSKRGISTSPGVIHYAAFNRDSRSASGTIPTS